MRLAVIFLLFAVVIEVCASFSCPDPCRRKWCVRHVEIGLRCVGNLVRDSCGCCYECAKQINESCGGLWNHGGTCDVGLMCQYSPSLPAIHPGICTRKGNVTSCVCRWGYYCVAT